MTLKRMSFLFKIFSLSIILASNAVLIISYPVYGNNLNETIKVPLIIGLSSFPKRVRANIGSFVRHSFKLKTSSDSSPISQLDIQVPESLKPSKSISISNQLGQSIDARLMIKDHTIHIVFLRPIDPGSTLEITMNIDQVLQTPNAWLYPISVKFVGYNDEISVGTLQFSNY